LEKTKVENLMRQAATKQKEGSNVDRFVSQLGNQSKQTQVLKKEDCIETSRLISYKLKKYLFVIIILSMESSDQEVVHAEISIIPIRSAVSHVEEEREEEQKTESTSMSKEIAVALDAIRKIKDIKATLTPMGTQIESNNIQNILKAIEAAHQAVKERGVKRIISTVRIDQRLDKPQTSKERVESVKEKLPSG
jgi:uncharacterized protein (TIGR00106 family)